MPARTASPEVRRGAVDVTAVELDDVGRILEIYVEAMLAKPAEVRPLADLSTGGRPAPAATTSRQPRPAPSPASPPARRPGQFELEGAAAPGRPTTDGAAFYLPERIDRFPDRQRNLMVYRMAVLHQLGSVLFGTWRRGKVRFADFFAGFDEPDLARALFGRLEGARIDAALARTFRGVRRDLLELIDDAMTPLPPPGAGRPRRRGRRTREDGMRELAVGLLQAQRRLLTDADRDRAPSPRAAGGSSDRTGPCTTGRSKGEAVARGLDDLPDDAPRLLGAGATVEDTRRAVASLYRTLSALPADCETRAGVYPPAEDEDPRDPTPSAVEPPEAQRLGMPAPAHHGDPAPERVELRGEWAELAAEVELRDDVDPGPVASGLMEQLQVDELGVLSLQDGDLGGAAGLPLTDLDITGAIEAEAGAAETAPIELDAEEIKARLEELSKRLERDLAEAGLGGEREQIHYYDEWDHDLGAWRRRWCWLREKAIEPLPADEVPVPGSLASGSDRFVDETRRRHADLLRRIRRQFELLKPVEFRRVRRLVEGEELDVDRVVETRVDRRAGLPPDGAVYMSRRRQHRDVAAAFLLDMSASTDAEAPVDEPEAEPGKPPEPEFVGVFDDFDWPDNPQPRPPGRRVIDIEKESLVLMADALETLGDDYAIYGFSGFGRKDVEFFVAKEFDDDLDREAEDRIAAIEPKRSTRMGPAIRHAAVKLAEREARVKVLLILSDGYPQDFDYGSDRSSRVHGIRDTMVALRETEREGVSTFCITVDPAGHDYLREMCPERSYLVIDDIAALPVQLPKVYRGLTS